MQNLNDCRMLLLLIFLCYCDWRQDEGRETLSTSLCYHDDACWQAGAVATDPNAGLWAPDIQ